MDRQSHISIVEQEITKSIDALVPNGAGSVTDRRLRRELDQVAQVAFREGASYALGSLLTVEDVAERLHISGRRVRAIARNRQERGFPVGWQVPGTSQWLFRPEDLDQLTPDEKYRRKN